MAKRPRRICKDWPGCACANGVTDSAKYLREILDPRNPRPEVEDWMLARGQLIQTLCCIEARCWDRRWREWARVRLAQLVGAPRRFFQEGLGPEYWPDLEPPGGPSAA